MEIIQPWKTEIARINVRDQFDMEAFSNEVFMMYSMTQGEANSQEKINAENFPVTMDMRDNLITPLVQKFAKRCFDTTLDDFYVETNGKWIEPGEGLFPHYHPGSVVSAICYPCDSNNGMTMFDPRGNACRGYPKPMRQAHFGNFTISPRAGDIFIFPSYIQHSVPHVTEDIRLSLLHEYYVTRNL